LLGLSGSLGVSGIPENNILNKEERGIEPSSYFRVSVVYSNGELEENMKKLFLLLFVVCFVAAFSMPAVAADVKFFGDYYIAGYWTKNYSLSDDPADNSQSRGNIGQRLRINTIFQVADGLKLTTRFDVMERMWGQDAAIGTPNPTPAGVGNNPEQNISWERAYVTFNLGPGFFDVGYQAEGYWSPIAFGNTTGSGPVIRYTLPIGPVTVGAFWENLKEAQVDPTVYGPADWDRVGLQGIFKWKSGQAGIQGIWEHYETNLAGQTFNVVWTNTTLANPGTLNLYEVSPFVQAKLGPVDLEGKLFWTKGTYELKANGSDIDIDGLTIYANGKVNMGSTYVGAMFAWIKGDDPSDSDRTISHGGGQDWDPCLMLGNDRYSRWQGGRYTTNMGWGTVAGGVPFRGGWNEENVWIYQGYVGLNPIPKLALKASFTYMKQDEKQVVGIDDHLGNELDITAAYKIYPNLEYMIGFGYLWTGDYFKGAAGTNPVDDNYLIMHQLTLTF